MVFGNKYIRNRRLLCADHNGQSLLILSLVENHFVLCFRNKAYSLIVLFVAPISFSVFFLLAFFHITVQMPIRWGYIRCLLSPSTNLALIILFLFLLAGCTLFIHGLTASVVNSRVRVLTSVACAEGLPGDKGTWSFISREHGIFFRLTWDNKRYLYYINGNFGEKFWGTMEFINGEQGRKWEIFKGSREQVFPLGGPLCCSLARHLQSRLLSQCFSPLPRK